jgi:hypothetical protein
MKAYLYRDGNMKLVLGVRTHLMEHRVVSADGNTIKIDVYRKHGLRGDYPVYSYVRTEKR